MTADFDRHVTSNPTYLADKIQALRADLVARFPERQNVIDGALASVLAGEHVLLLGPPGTAKSALARAIAKAFGGSYFERLLTKFSTPDELFGPVSLKALEQDRFERVIAGKLPEAEFVFIDETFKANSAILNSLLTLMNERIYHNDGLPLVCPLVTMFGASNELPEGRELEAMFDRFLVRFDVQYLVQLSNLRAVLLAPDPVISAHLTMEELRTAQAEVAKVVVDEATVDGMVSIREGCQSEGIIASDRRWKKALKLVRASAYMLGSMKTTPEDLHILVDSLWREPKERNKVARIVGQQSDPVGTVANEILEAARETAQRMVTLKKKGRAEYIGAAAQAIDQFVEQKNKLVELSKTGGKRAKVVIADAQREIQGMHAEAARVAMEGLGMGKPNGKKGSWMKDVDASLDAE
jgi:MoxR-like ATPase